MNIPIFISFLSILALLTGSCNQQNLTQNHANLKLTRQSNLIIKKGEKQIPLKISEIELPDGFYRQQVDSLSFASYLRNLPLNSNDNTIYAYDGSVISHSGYHYAIIDIDVGTRDLQQCADAIMRLRAEYFYQLKQYKKIHFNFLSDGKPRYYVKYSSGDWSYKKFRKYLDFVFSYANSSSLRDEMQAVENVNDMQIGHCFVQKGSPIGHAVIVVDMAINKQTGEKIFLLAQSYMPAQSIHILSNLHNQKLDPWYPVSFNDDLILPGWTFYKKDLRHFK